MYAKIFCNRSKNIKNTVNPVRVHSKSCLKKEWSGRKVWANFFAMRCFEIFQLFKQLNREPHSHLNFSCSGVGSNLRISNPMTGWKFKWASLSKFWWKLHFLAQHFECCAILHDNFQCSLSSILKNYRIIVNSNVPCRQKFTVKSYAYFFKEILVLSDRQGVSRPPFNLLSW